MMGQFGVGPGTRHRVWVSGGGSRGWGLAAAACGTSGPVPREPGPARPPDSCRGCARTSGGRGGRAPGAPALPALPGLPLELPPSYSMGRGVPPEPAVRGPGGGPRRSGAGPGDMAAEAPAVCRAAPSSGPRGPAPIVSRPAPTPLEASSTGRVGREGLGPQPWVSSEPAMESRSRG